MVRSAPGGVASREQRTCRSSSSGDTTMLEKYTSFLSSLAPSSRLRMLRERVTKPRNALW